MSAAMRRAMLTASLPLIPVDIGTPPHRYPTKGAAIGSMKVWINDLGGEATNAGVVKNLRFWMLSAAASGTATFFTTATVTGVSGSGQAVIKKVGPSIAYGSVGSSEVWTAADLAVDGGDLLGVHLTTAVDLSKSVQTGNSVWYKTGSGANPPTEGASYTALNRTSGSLADLRGHTP